MKKSTKKQINNRFKNNSDEMIDLINSGVKFTPFRYSGIKNKSVERLIKYGSNVEEYEKLLIEQNYVCAICKCSNGNRKLCIDHCHSTDLFRGLLCSKCNVGLGYFKDNIEYLENAIEYLQNFNDSIK